MRAILICAVLIAGCGTGRDNTSYRLEGECAAPAGTQAVTPLHTTDWSCTLGAPPVYQLVDSQAALDAFGTTCHLSDGKPVDFAIQQLVLVNGQGGNGGGTTINFIVDDGTQRQLGLTYVPAGFRFNDFALVLPRTQLPLVTRRCDQVCVSGCDRAIP